MKGQKDMIRIFKNANREYIEKLLDEMEEDNDNTYEFQIKEERENANITMLNIHVRKIEECCF